MAASMTVWRLVQMAKEHLLVDRPALATEAAVSLHGEDKGAI